KGNTVRIDEEQTRHIEKVLRLKSGDIVKVFDGNGNEYQLRLQEKRQKKLQAEILSRETMLEDLAINLTLVQGIARSEKMDFIIQKAVELGVRSIIPLQSEYSVARFNEEKEGKKIKRWQKIAQEACKQCGRNHIPEVEPVLDFSALMAHIGDKPALLCYEQEKEVHFRTLLREQRENFCTRGLFLIIGPEGGFSPAEVEIARRQGLFIAGLGPRILRTETASLLACGIIMYEYGELG
ncbi:MAG: 16S rRNA (uracil(1498)-N(3))-methyltransferase, partial [Syntrophomonas sp.]|nr:16S rRNA (uracil(1498)-N(3))-methyltransferase [Syntrophomonas sp.]